VAISVAQARQICTQAELDLVLKSTTRQIGSLDAKELRAAIRRSRTLRDKWRDLKHEQRRGTKIDNPEKLESANLRSKQKAELFDEALTRFEKRLSKLEPQPGKESTGTKRVTKPTRSAEHRQSRAEVRGKLAEKTEMLNAPEPAAKTKKSATKAAPAAKAKTAAKKASTTKKPPKRKAPPLREAPAPINPVAPTEGLAAATMAAGRPPVGGDSLSSADKKRNLKATTAAKARRVSRSGATRIQGHVSSQGRRNQAKRGNR